MPVDLKRAGMRSAGRPFPYLAREKSKQQEEFFLSSYDKD